MTPARNQDAPRRHVPPSAAAPDGTRSADAEPRGQHLQPAGAFAPPVAVRTAPHMRLQRHAGDARRGRLAVDAGGQGGTYLAAMHAAIVPGAGPRRSTAPRAGGRRA